MLKRVKRKLLYLVCLCIIVFISGCSKIQRNNIDLSGANIDSTYVVSNEVKKLEVMNIYNDTELYMSLYMKVQNELKVLGKSSKNDKEKKAAILLNDFTSDVYKLANSRVIADIGTIYTNSEEYMSYIAMLQTFVDSYSKEHKKYQEMALNADREFVNTSSYKMLITIDTYYLNIINEDSEAANQIETKNQDEKSSNHKASLDDLIEGTQE